MQGQQDEHWVDDPIKHSKEDAFGRAAYAGRAGDLIVRSHSWDSSVVFGLTGAWGSGKSSVVAMMSEHLQTKYADWSVAQFTPWATANLDGLLAEFYGAIGQALPLNRRKAFLRSASSLLRIAAPAAQLLPYGGGAVEGMASQAADLLVGHPSWAEKFSETAEKLHEIGQKVLIVADDIDRLQADELLGLLKVVRLLGRFPGVQYLLAYDDETIFRTLRSSSIAGNDPRAAQRFIEKIVQYPLSVPPLLGYQQLEVIQAGLSGALTARPGVDKDELPELTKVLQTQLSTPRSIGRFLAQLKHHIPMLPPEEINDLDVIRLTLLRTAFPTVYSLLPKWRDALLSGHTSSYIVKNGSVEYERLDIDILLSDIDARDKEDAKNLLIAMFPRLEKKDSDPPGSRRISDGAYFDRYLSMGVPSADISNLALAAALLGALNGQPEALEGLLRTSDQTRTYLAFDKMAELAPEDDLKRLKLIKTIGPIIRDLGVQNTGLWFSPRHRARLLVSDWLREANPLTPPSAVLDAMATVPLVEAIRIWKHVQTALRVPWVLELGSELAARATDALVRSLALKDSAPSDDNAIAFLHFALSVETYRPHFIERVRAEIEEGTFSAEDLAARFVTLELVDPDPNASDLRFDSDLWDELAAPASLTLTPPPAGTVVGRDPGWANRRLIARQQAGHRVPEGDL